MKKGWRGSYYSDHEIDLFEYKDEFFNALTDNELEIELERRNKEKDNISEKKYSCYVDVDIDISDFKDEIIYGADDYDLIAELENRGYYISNKTVSNKFNGELKELAKYLGLREWSTKEQVIREINFYINNEK